MSPALAEVRRTLPGEAIRALFPALRAAPGRAPLVYLDSAATALKPVEVIAAEAEFYRHNGSSVHRASHALGRAATEAYEAGRARVASWLGVPDPAGVVFCRNATAALNLVARGLEARLVEGDEVLLSEMEHHANLVPWLMLARRRGLVLRYLGVTPAGELDLEQLDAKISPRTRVVSLCLVSNVLGTINPVAQVAAAAHRVGALMVVDAAQAAGHLPLRLSELGADLLVLSAHKCYGPTGVGVLAGTATALATLEPVEGGGEMIEEVHLDRATWAEVPARFEGGTPNVAGVVGTAAALDLLQRLGADAVRAHEREIAGYAWERLGALDLSLLGPADPARRGGLISFVDPAVHPGDLAAFLDARGVALRAGHHCAQPLHRRLGLDATLRASFGVYTTRADIDALVEGIRDGRKIFA